MYIKHNISEIMIKCSKLLNIDKSRICKLPINLINIRIIGNNGIKYC